MEILASFELISKSFSILATAFLREGIRMRGRNGERKQREWGQRQREKENIN